MRAPIGELHVTRLDPYSLCYRIDRADTRILVSGKLAELMVGPSRGCGDLVGRRLVVHGVNRKVVYVFTGYDPQKDVYEAEWPD